MKTMTKVRGSSGRAVVAEAAVVAVIAAVIAAFFLEACSRE